MARRDEVDNGKPRDWLMPVGRRRGRRVRQSDSDTRLPKLNREQQKLLDSLCKQEEERTKADDDFGTDY